MASYEELEKAIRNEHKKLKEFESIQRLLPSYNEIIVEDVDKEKVESIQEKIKREALVQYTIERITQYVHDLVKSGASRDFVIEQTQSMINLYNLLNKSQLIVDITALANRPE